MPGRRKSPEPGQMAGGGCARSESSRTRGQRAPNRIGLCRPFPGLGLLLPARWETTEDLMQK